MIKDAEIINSMEYTINIKCVQCKRIEGGIYVDSFGKQQSIKPSKVIEVLTGGKVSIYTCSNGHVFSVWEE